jgi:starch phosphorylase
MSEPATPGRKTSTDQLVAYFSMEIALEEKIPTYSGGLGVLAGDTVRSAADLAIPLVAVSLVHRKGYFRQQLDAAGNQAEQPASWAVGELLKEADVRTSVEIEQRTVWLRAWTYEVKGVSGFVVPVYLLDSDVDGNSEWDRRITDHLYGGDDHYRLCQEVILGIGGVRMLRALGYHSVKRFHMNEGHASLLTLELGYELATQASETIVSRERVRDIKPLCVFTTHTPVRAGHDQYPLDLVARVITGYGHAFDERAREFCLENVLNMTYLALDNSHFINGVAKRHGEIAQHMFAQYPVDSITNGVHVATWAAPSTQAMFDRHIPGWRRDNLSLRYALGIPRLELWEAHRLAKQELLRAVREATGTALDLDTFTLGFARRATAYKRHDLLFWDIDRLVAIHDRVGHFQLLFGGKAHPRDDLGKELIRRVFAAKAKLEGKIKIVYLEEYDISLARLMTAGVDAWLNTPQEPLEASGTSGMKAALNGVPSFSVLDGWWVEGCIEGVTGWSIGANRVGTEVIDDRAEDAHALYDKLEHVILPTFYQQRDVYIDVMRHAIALNGSFFNTERMMDQYVRKAYF